MPPTNRSARPPGPETWEAIADSIFDRLQAERDRLGKVEAAQLAHKALTAIAPARAGKGTTTMDGQLERYEDITADCLEVRDYIARTKGTWEAEQSARDDMERLIRRFPRAVEAALGKQTVQTYKAVAGIRMKAKNARALYTRALTLMEGLGESMDDSAYGQLMEPIIRQLDQAQRTMEQGATAAGRLAAAGGVTMKKEAKTKPTPSTLDLLMGAAQSQAAEHQVISNLHAAARGEKS